MEIAPILGEQHITIKAVRIDSGDLAEHAHRVRRILDRGGLHQVGIFASSIDEYVLQQLRQQRAPIDGFGIGTRMDTSADAPYLDCAYKLQEYAGIARRKRSEGKSTWPGRKQVYRRCDPDGLLLEDIVTVHEAPCAGQPLLQQVMHAGRLTSPLPALDASRDYALQQLQSLPEPLRRLQKPPDYPVRISPELQELAQVVDRKIQ